MENKKFIIVFLLTFFFAFSDHVNVHSGTKKKTQTLQVKGWAVTYNNILKGVDIRKESKLIYKGIYASYKWKGRTISTKDYLSRAFETRKIRDKFGYGFLYEMKYSEKGLPTLCQCFYLYPGKDYLLTDFYLESSGGISSNYMAPVNVDAMPPVLDTKGENRALFVPFDNDNWIRYRSCPLDFESLTSYEITVVFDNWNRYGIIVGSVEHDNWKSAIVMGKGDRSNIGSLRAYGGIADENTRDKNPHGSLVGNKIKSPKFLLGYFNDWREGLEAYARANTLVVPRRVWKKAMPFGWNSWGVLQFNLSYEKAMEVSDYFKKNLQGNYFANPDHTLYIGLDSGWSGFSEAELKSFVAQCKKNGQEAGIYWTPFAEWSKDPDRKITDAPQYTNKEVYLYAQGKPEELDGAYALDPTHPAVEAMIKQKSAMFHKLGFKYIKLDFMTHGALEADRWYDRSVTTGMQAYNYGMKLIDKYFGDMYINLSISPLFPAQYAQSRRIACDSWNKIKDTEYTMNACSYGWWLNGVYRYNDPDHVVLRGASEGENRARVTSAVISGIFISGDDFSASGSTEGKQKALKFLTNREINAVATGISFRPVEGNGEKSENCFVRKEKNGTCYYAIFNYTDSERTYAVSFSRLGLSQNKKYRVKDLWRGINTVEKNRMEVKVPSKDVMLFRISKINSNLK